MRVVVAIWLQWSETVQYVSQGSYLYDVLETREQISDKPVLGGWQGVAVFDQCVNLALPYLLTCASFETAL